MCLGRWLHRVPTRQSITDTLIEGVRDPKLATIERFFTAYAANDRDGIASVLAEEIDEVLACFAALDSVGFKAETFFLQAGDDYVVDIHRGYSTGGDGKVDTTWALVWHLDAAGKVDRVVNLSGDQHQMDAFIWANFPLKPLPERLVG
jgi:uncharacterized protein